MKISHYKQIAARKFDLVSVHSTFGQRPFFEIRIFKGFAQRNSKMEVEKCFRSIENEKKQGEQGTTYTVNKFFYSFGFRRK